MTIYVNRTLNLKKIRVIGFDMDHTLIRYDTANFESLAHRETIKNLIARENYPEDIAKLTFNFHHVIQGLVIDRERGYLLKISRYGKVKTAYFGLDQVGFRQQQAVYRNRVIDLSDEQYHSLDTAFSISKGALYSQLVQLKKEGLELPSYHQISIDVRKAVNLCHADGSIKSEVRKNIKNYIIRDPDVAAVLERYKSAGKRLIVITNSDYDYSKLLMDYAITPFLSQHKCWSDVFDLVVTFARKPAFFTTYAPFLKIDPSKGTMTNTTGPITHGLYQGGWAGKLQEDLGLEGEQFLYIGDHIYGDVVSIKKTFNWRTALVLEHLGEEVAGIKKAAPIQLEIDSLMAQKQELETSWNQLENDEYANGRKVTEQKKVVTTQIEEINSSISNLINKYGDFFNSYWGEMMRAGQEESRFADQVEKYACIYMTRIGNMLDYSPRTYFRPQKRVLPHECQA